MKSKDLLLACTFKVRQWRRFLWISMVPSVFQRWRRIHEVGTIDLVNRRGCSRRKAAILIDERHCPFEN